MLGCSTAHQHGQLLLLRHTLPSFTARCLLQHMVHNIHSQDAQWVTEPTECLASINLGIATVVPSFDEYHNAVHSVDIASAVINSSECPHCHETFRTRLQERTHQCSHQPSTEPYVEPSQHVPIAKVDEHNIDSDNHDAVHSDSITISIDDILRVQQGDEVLLLWRKAAVLNSAIDNATDNNRQSSSEHIRL